MTAERLSSHQLLKDLLRAHRGQAAGRAPLDEQNPVDWDDTPTFYQATTIAHGHILQFRQVWKADGYSLGDLLHSIPLAPCQKKQIVTIDWDRREDATRTEDLTEREVLFANLVRDRDVKEMMDTALSESIDGGSTAKTYGGGGGLGFAIGPLVIGAAGGGGGADSEAWQDSSREISGQTMQELKDRINQSAAAVRSQRATVVQTLGQGERSRVTTEVIANHNHCHALTIQYFEVLRHFQVLEELAEVRECLFVPFLMSPFHDAKVLRWREALEPQPAQAKPPARVRCHRAHPDQLRRRRLSARDLRRGAARGARGRAARAHHDRAAARSEEGRSRLLREGVAVLAEADRRQPGGRLRPVPGQPAVQGHHLPRPARAADRRAVHRLAARRPDRRGWRRGGSESRSHPGLQVPSPARRISSRSPTAATRRRSRESASLRWRSGPSTSCRNTRR